MSDFLFGVHLHQPTENLKEAVDRAVEMCYAPFFETMKKYPEFKFSMHCSGWLFNELKTKYPDVFENIKKCNIEFFTAGFYEPVLAVIPREDRIVQIKKLNAFIEANFGVTPKGLWLTERVWDDGIIPEMVSCGVEYTAVDDYHIKAEGIEADSVFETEESGKRIKIFPISKNLRYKIPFSNVDEAIEAIKNEKMPVMFDDCEKFGLWPTTYEWVYEKKWLEEFIEKALKELNMLHFSEFKKPSKLIYLPNVSYPEMMEWCLDFGVEGRGVFKNFFKKYKESNHIHKRMLNINNKNKSYYKLQTNDVYWHGIFGGLYLPNLRDNAYRFLIECDNEKGVFVSDFDMDGYEEVSVKTEKIIAVFNKNGELIEFDDRNKKFNFLNTIRRYKERYHFENKKEKNKKVATIHEIRADLGKYKEELFFDRYYRYSFIDHLIKEVDNESFKKDNFKDFIKRSFKREDLTFTNAQIKKSFEIEKNGINFEIENKTDFVYAMEMNFHFAWMDKIEIGQKYILDPFTERKIIFDFEYDKMFYFILNTINRDEKGFCKIAQGVSMLFTFKNKNIKGKICLK